MKLRGFSKLVYKQQRYVRRKSDCETLVKVGYPAKLWFIFYIQHTVYYNCQVNKDQRDDNLETYEHPIKDFLFSDLSHFNSFNTLLFNIEKGECIKKGRMLLFVIRPF